MKPDIFSYVLYYRANILSESYVLYFQKIIEQSHSILYSKNLLNYHRYLEAIYWDEMKIGKIA